MNEITKKIAEYKLGKWLHKDHVNYAAEFKGTLAQYFDSHKDGAWMFFIMVKYGLESKYLTKTRIDACAAKKPHDAIMFGGHLLSPERIALIAKKDPFHALRYLEKYMTAEQIALCRDVLKE